MLDTRQSPLARREIRLLEAEKKKAGKLSLSYIVQDTFPSEKHRQASMTYVGLRSIMQRLGEVERTIA